MCDTTSDIGISRHSINHIALFVAANVFKHGRLNTITRRFDYGRNVNAPNVLIIGTGVAGTCDGHSGNTIFGIAAAADC